MKKLNKFVAILVALAMMAALAVTSAFAAELTPEQKNSDPKLVKYLKMADGITIPANVDFTFDFRLTNAPTGSTASDKTATINTNDMSASKGAYDAGSIIGNKPISEIITDLDKPGVYTYTVKETPGQDSEHYTYDDTEYTLKLYVSKNGDDLKIDSATVQTGTADKENTTTTDPTEDQTSDDVEKGAGNGFTFVNTYAKTASEERKENNAALKVSKTVNENVDDNFGFSLTVTLNNKDDRYNSNIPAYIKTADGQVEKALKLYEANSIELKHGEELVILELPAGTTYVVKENLTSSGLQNQNDIKADATTTGIDAVKSWEGVDGATEAQAGKNLIVTSASTGVEDGNTVANAVAVTNNADAPKPEGILISNLPYIALALVAVGGLVAYVVVRRKADDEA